MWKTHKTNESGFKEMPEDHWHWFEALGKLTGLRELNLDFLSQITDAGLRHLIGLVSLAVLSLQAWRQLTDNGMEWVAAVPALTNIHMTGCWEVTLQCCEQVRASRVTVSFICFGRPCLHAV